MGWPIFSCLAGVEIVPPTYSSTVGYLPGHRSSFFSRKRNKSFVCPSDYVSPDSASFFRRRRRGERRRPLHCDLRRDESPPGTHPSLPYRSLSSLPAVRNRASRNPNLRSDPIYMYVLNLIDSIFFAKNERATHVLYWIRPL